VPSTTEAIVLRRSVYKESSFICDALTPQGIVPVIARGVRREKSALTGLCEPLDQVSWEMTESHSAYRYLTGGRILHHLDRALPYPRLEALYAVTELIARIQAPDEDWRGLYESVQLVMSDLETRNEDPARILFRWIWQLFKLLGCTPEWAVCPICHQPNTLPLGYDIVSGNLICRQHTGPMPGLIELSDPESREITALYQPDLSVSGPVSDPVRRGVVTILLTHLSAQYRVPFILKSLHSRDIHFR
jgi:DNA repair protein RecO